MLQRRCELLRQVRRFFEERGFTEVETPCLSRDVVVDRHLDPIPVTLFSDPREPARGQQLWLQTSPEFAMKRLLANGAKAIFQVAHAFRGGPETGPLHNPEFTLLEWYRLGDEYLAGRTLLSELAAATLGRGQPESLSYGEAFRLHAGVDPFADATARLQEAAADFGLIPSSSPDSEAAERDLLLDLLLTGKVEPRLGLDRPVILYDYPPSQAALAQVRDGEHPVAERFELYDRGVELANGYHELLDPAVLRARNRANNALRAADGKCSLPEESRLLSAMEHGLPPCAGCALGFDRLAMLALGAQSIAEVTAFPLERA